MDEDKELRENFSGGGVVITIISVLCCVVLCVWKIFLMRRASCSHSGWAVFLSAFPIPFDAISLMWKSCCKLASNCVLTE